MALTYVVGGDQFTARLRRLAGVVSPAGRMRANRKAGIALHANVMRTFRAQGATDGRPKWEPLKAGGRWKGKGKARRFQSSYQLLQDSGAMRQSFVPLADADSAGVGALSTKGHADIAPSHQYGYNALPARPMLPELRTARQIVLRVYELEIVREAK